MIACRTVIGHGAPTKAGRARRARRAARGRRGRGGARAARLEPCAVRGSRGCVCRLRQGCRPWGEREGGLGGAAGLLPDRAAFLSAQAGEAPGLTAAMADYKAGLLRDRPKVATRKASEMALEVVNAAVPFTVGGSADLTGSNLTRIAGMRPVTRDDFGGALRPLRHPRARDGGGDERDRAARRLPAVRRHVPGVRRLCAAGDPAGGADAGADGLRDDPRLDRARRGRADAPAGRASGEPQGDPGPDGDPAGRRGGDRGGLGDRDGGDGRAGDAGAVAAEPAARCGTRRTRTGWRRGRICCAIRGSGT